MENILYFAYGSNLDKKRMIERGCTFESVSKAILKDHVLVFDKKSLKMPGITFANVQPKKGSIVEGMLYTMGSDKIKFLDKFEGYPKHYGRELMKVTNDDVECDAYVYVAAKEWISEGVPSKEYMSHILAGKEYLSPAYYKMLESQQTMNESISFFMDYTEFLLEKRYEKFYSKKELSSHLKKFMNINVSADAISQKVINFYNYSVDFLCKKYPGYDIEKSAEEGPADEEYMSVLSKIVKKVS